MHKNYIIVFSITIILYLQSCVSLQNFFTSVFKESGNILVERMQQEGWDTEILDTARDVSYLTEVEKDVVLLHNAVRSNPKKFNELYVKAIKDFHHRDEGSVASNELYQKLQKQSSLPLLQPSKGMSQAFKQIMQKISLLQENGDIQEVMEVHPVNE